MRSPTRRLLLVFVLLGLGASLASAYVHYRLLANPSYTSFCDVSATVSCTQAFLSRYGSLAGAPVAVLGTLWFVLALILVLAAGKGPAPFRDNVPAYLFAMSTLGLAVVLYLAYASFFVLRSACPLCLLTYVAVGGVFVVSGGATSFPMKRLPRRALRDLRALAASPVALAIMVMFVAAAASAVAVFPRERSVPGGGAAAVPQPLPQDQRTEFERWYDAQPKMNLPVLADGANVLVVKFTDFQCPACGEAYQFYKSVLAKYAASNPGEVKLVNRDFPLDGKCNPHAPRGPHPSACDAAVAVRLAARQGREAAMEEWLYTNQASLTPVAVRAAARNVGGIQDYDARYADALEAVKADIALAALNGVQSTPTFFINGTRIVGTLPPQFFDAAIQYELRRAAK